MAVRMCTLYALGTAVAFNSWSLSLLAYQLGAKHQQTGLSTVGTKLEQVFATVEGIAAKRPVYYMRLTTCNGNAKITHEMNSSFQYYLQREKELDSQTPLGPES